MQKIVRERVYWKKLHYVESRLLLRSSKYNFLEIHEIINMTNTTIWVAECDFINNEHCPWHLWLHCLKFLSYYRKIFLHFFIYLWFEMKWKSYNQIKTLVKLFGCHGSFFSVLIIFIIDSKPKTASKAGKGMLKKNIRYKEQKAM